MSTRLSPGDLCTVVPTAPDILFCPGCVGRTVILLSPYRLDELAGNVPGVYWRVSGMPDGITGCHENILRKIPPAPMDDDELREICRVMT